MKTRNQEPQSSTSGSGISGLDVLFLVFLTGALFYPYIFRDQLPFPTDIILALQRNENIWAGKGSVDNLYTTDCVVDCYPRAYHAWTQRRESYHPNWYPYSSCGQPNYQNPTRSPLMILGDVMNPADAYALGMVVSVGLSGLTMLLFLWELGVSRGARWAGAALYMLCGNSVYFLPLLHFTEATAALPLLLLAIRRLSLDGRGPDGATPLTGGYRATQGVLLAFSFAWILLSRADIAILTVALSGSYGLYLVALRPGSRVRRLMLMAFAATCGLGLAFFEIGPFLSVLQASPRVQRKGSATWNPVENLERVGITIAGAVVPDILGDPSTSSSRLPYHHKPYCGIVPLILLAFFRRGRDTSFFLAALVFCLLCGTNTPLRNLAIGLYPPLGFFDPYRCFWMTMPCMAVLFARGIDALHDDSSSEDRGRIVIGVGALAFAGAVLILLFATPGRLEPIFQRIAASRFEADTREYQERFDVDSRRRSYQDRWTTLRQTLLKAMVLATLALVVLYGRRRFGTRFTLASLLALLLVDLYPFAWRYLSGGPRSDL